MRAIRRMPGTRRIYRALVGGLLVQPSRLVVPVQRRFGELVLELRAVVGAEQEVAGREGDTDVRLGAAAVAAVEGGEGGIELQLVHGVGDLRHGALLGL